MSVILRLQHLPWTANAMDIRRFFHGLQIPDGGVHIVGGDNGDAFIAFSSDEDARKAMQMDNLKVNDQPVRLLLSSKSEMQNVIAIARGQMMGAMEPPKPEPPATSYDRPPMFGQAPEFPHGGMPTHQPGAPPLSFMPPPYGHPSQDALPAPTKDPYGREIPPARVYTPSDAPPSRDMPTRPQNPSYRDYPQVDEPRSFRDGEGRRDGLPHMGDNRPGERGLDRERRDMPPHMGQGPPRDQSYRSDQMPSDSLRRDPSRGPSHFPDMSHPSGEKNMREERLPPSRDGRFLDGPGLGPPHGPPRSGGPPPYDRPPMSGPNQATPPGPPTGSGYSDPRSHLSMDHEAPSRSQGPSSEPHSRPPPSGSRPPEGHGPPPAWGRRPDSMGPPRQREGSQPRHPEYPTSSDGPPNRRPFDSREPGPPPPAGQDGQFPPKFGAPQFRDGPGANHGAPPRYMDRPSRDSPGPPPHLRNYQPSDRPPPDQEGPPPHHEQSPFGQPPGEVHRGPPRPGFHDRPGRNGPLEQPPSGWRDSGSRYDENLDRSRDRDHRERRDERRDDRRNIPYSMDVERGPMHRKEEPTFGGEKESGEQDVYIYVSNLPRTVSSRDVRRFFYNIDILPDGIKLINDRHGNRIGSAFIKVVRERDTITALGLDSEIMNDRKVRIVRTTEREFVEAVDSYVPSRERSRSPLHGRSQDHERRPRGRSPKRSKRSSSRDRDHREGRDRSPRHRSDDENCIIIHSFPVKATREDLKAFFKPLRLGRRVFVEHDRNSNLGMCYIDFSSNRDFKDSLKFHRKTLLNQPVEIYPMKRDGLKQIHSQLRNNEKPGKIFRDLGESERISTREPEPSQTKVDQGLVSKQGPGADSHRRREEMRRDPREEVMDDVMEDIIEGSMEPPTCCVRIDGLPFSANFKMVQEFFRGCKIAWQGIHIVQDGQGQAVGHAFVEFVTVEDCQRALIRDKQYMGKRYIEIMSISKEEFDHEVEQSNTAQIGVHRDQVGMGGMRGPPRHPGPGGPRGPPPRPGLRGPAPMRGLPPHHPHMMGPRANGRFARPPHPNKQRGFVVGGRNFPFMLNEKNMMEFFGEFHPIPGSFNPLLHDGKPTGKASVAFHDQESAEAAISALNNQVFNGRPVALYRM